jgi:hypothetical protein
MANQDFTTGTEQNLLDWYFTAGAAPTRPTAWWLGLFSVLPTANAGTGGTELTGAGGYARQAVTFVRTDRTLNPDAVVTFGPASGADWAEAVGFGIFSAETAGTLYAFKALTTPRVVAVGETSSFATAALSITQD